jgi:hypothetical protein
MQMPAVSTKGKRDTALRLLNGALDAKTCKGAKFLLERMLKTHAREFEEIGLMAPTVGVNWEASGVFNKMEMQIRLSICKRRILSEMDCEYVDGFTQFLIDLDALEFSQREIVDAGWYAKRFIYSDRNGRKLVYRIACLYPGRANYCVGATVVGSTSMKMNFKPSDVASLLLGKRKKEEAKALTVALKQGDEGPEEKAPMAAEVVVVAAGKAPGKMEVSEIQSLEEREVVDGSGPGDLEMSKGYRMHGGEISCKPRWRWKVIS